jgi:predicted RNase H-like nuclease (RuvC/YqgF family)
LALPHRCQSLGQATLANVQDINSSTPWLSSRRSPSGERGASRRGAKVETLTSQNTELTGANEQLKKDNKDLKNIVDQIKLQLARDTKALLQYEDNQIRRAVIKLFRWTLG